MIDPGSVLASTEEAVEAARVDGVIGPADAGAVAALFAVARKIDAQDLYFDELLDRAEASGGKPPPMDNVSLPTYLKYCSELGLTPNGRAAIIAKRAARDQVENKPANGGAPEKKAGTVTQLRSMKAGLAR